MYDENYIKGNGHWDSKTDGFARDEVDPYGWAPPSFSTQKNDPWEKTSVYLWKSHLYDSYTCSLSWISQVFKYYDLTITVPPEEGVCSDSIITLGGISRPGSLPEEKRDGSASYFFDIFDWLPTSPSEPSTQKEMSAFSTSIPISISYDPAAIQHLVESQLTINKWDETSNSWITLATTLDTNTHTASAQTDSIGSYILQAPLVCPADTLEVNDNLESASDLDMDGYLMDNLFDIAADEDWFRFDAIAGTNYTLQTNSLAAGVDTLLEVIDKDGMTRLKS